MNTVDSIFLAVMVIVIFYAYYAGFFRLIKPVVSIICARLVCPVVSVLLQKGPIGEKVRERASEALSSYIGVELDKFESLSSMADYIAGAAIAVVAFFVTYFILRLLLEYLYALFKPNFAFAKKVDKALGIVLGIFTVIAFFYITYKGSYYLSLLNVEMATNITTDFEDSWIVMSIIKMFNVFLGWFSW